MAAQKEVWLRGEKTEGLSPILQPAVDALREAQEEINSFLQDFPETLLWETPAGCASVGFHLQHIVGFLDRLFTYAKGANLSESQLKYLQQEATPNDTSLAQLTVAFNNSIKNAIDQLIALPEKTLAEPRRVGRAGLPTTVIGLYFHAAEHTMRHTGQLLVTTRVLRNNFGQ